MSLTLWNDETSAVVVLASDADSTETFAAKELAAYLGRMSGREILISDSPDEHGTSLIVGRTACEAEGFSPDDALTDDGFMIVSRENRICITGTHPRGTMFGVYEFLEECLGCRFFSPEVEKIPFAEKMVLEPLHIKRVPLIEYRSSSVFQLNDPLYAAKRKINGQTMRAAESIGGRVEYGKPYFVHTFCRNLLRPEDYFDEHPEYFSEINGERIREKTQLCLTNPDVLRLVTEQVLEDIRKQPNARIFSVSQDDNYNGCTCAKCRALDEYEGSQAGSLLHFVNAVAEAVEKEFPDVIIDTLAYQYTRRPPKHVRARRNVCVRLCSIECCFLHPLAECTDDDPDAPRKDYAQSFRDDLIDWGKKCDRLYIWDYVTNFSHFWMPHPNLHVLAENVRFFYENNVRGLFEQGCPAPAGGEMNDLRAYILSKAMWDPYVDPAKLRAEFLRAVYGNAAEHIDRYLETVHRAVEEAGCHLYCFNHPDKPWHTMELVEECERIFDETKKAADDEQILRRIRFQEMAVRYLRILLTPKGTKLRNDLIDTFTPDMKAFGIGMLWERADADTCLAILKGEQEPGYWWAK
ncbi:MAG: DUF4838 domain-containing protein [Clostridia bacterium]|nr:DUF4838 domain-containing protein [Clostridia bacterium]